MSYNPLPTVSLSSESVVTQYTNASAITAIPQAQAVSTNSSGLIVPFDVSNPSNYNNFVGYANARIPTSSLGPVVSNGRLLNYTTGLSIGTPLWIDTFGNPTSTTPSIGVNGFMSGDAVFFLGVLVANSVSGIDIAIFTQFTGIL